MKKVADDPNEVDIGASGTMDYEVMVKMVLGNPNGDPKWLFCRKEFKKAVKQIVEEYILTVSKLPEIDESTRDRLLAELEELEKDVKGLDDVYRYKFICVRLFTIINLLLGYRYTGGHRLHTPYFIQSIGQEIVEKEVGGQYSSPERFFDKSSEVQTYRRNFIKQLKVAGLTNAKIGIILGMTPQQVARLNNTKNIK
jgi:hypothetical protein